MLKSLRHALVEGRRAAALAKDKESKRVLRSDFFWSRLLRFWKPPSYNSLRVVRMLGKNVHYRFNRGDLQSLREVLVEEVYSFDLPFQPKSLLDLGANIGLTSLKFASQYEFELILGVEPLLENAEVAKMNFAANTLPGHIIRSAVGISDGEVLFLPQDESNLGRVAMAGSRNCITVPMVKIETLLSEFPLGKVDLVKIDIEGGEGPLFTHDLAWLDNVRSIMIEWHDEQVDSTPLRKNIVSCGFQHARLNSCTQDNLSVFWRE